METTINVAKCLAGHRSELTIHEFLQLAVRMASRVAELHASGWIHGEIAPPSFVLSTPDAWTTEPFDFSSAHLSLLGSAHPTRADVAPRSATEVEGPLDYVAPERTGRVQIPFDHRADLYSLGATFYDMLTGAPPFVSNDPTRVVHGHVAAVPPAPRVKSARVPRVLSEMVMRLLEKMPEHRYQTASAVVDDLEEARGRLRASGEVDDFEIGRTDPGRKFGTPRALYGRTAELQVLHNALRRCIEGAHEFVLVAGPSGIGKSLLARIALAGHPWVGSSKFDALGTRHPYATVADAVMDLLGRLLDAPVELRARTSNRARAALANDGRALLALLPNLEQLTGTLPPLPSIDVTDGDPRTRMALRALIGALAAPDSPIALFLDDLHWADSATLDFIGSLVAGDGFPHLLVLGTFRPDAVTDAHPLARLIRDLDRTDSRSQRVGLLPLNPAALTALCADWLYTDEGTVAPLATVVANKATGNPLFVERFLHQLQREGAIRVDVIRRTCTYSLARVAAAEVSDDVVELMRSAIDALPARVQRVLAIAACFREVFMVDDLSRLVHEPVQDVEAYVFTARAEGLLVPVTRDGTRPAPSYRFVHDRVKQAAYAHLDDNLRAETHLAIGFQLLAAIPDPSGDDRLFEAIDHLSRGGQLLREPAERAQLVELHRAAAHRAKASSGFAAAHEYYLKALAFLPDDAQRTHHALFMELLQGAVVSGFLAGEVEAADGMAREWGALLPDLFDRAELLRLRVLGLTAADRLGDAIQCVEEAAALLGCSLPARGDEEHVRERVLSLANSLSQLEPGALARAPALSDARLMLCMRVLSAANAATWLHGDPTLFAAAQAEMVAITLEDGVAPASGGALVRFGAMYAAELGDPGPGYEISARGLALALESSDLRIRCRARFGMAFHISHFRIPLRSCVEEFHAVAALGADCGQFAYVGYASHRGIEAALAMGLELPAVVQEIDRASAFAHRYELQSILTDLTMLRGVIRCLQGTAETHELLATDAENLVRTRAELFARLNVWMLEVAYLFRRPAPARVHARAAEPLLRTMPSTLTGTAYTYYDALSRAAALEQADDGERARELRLIEDRAARLELWAKSCPDNFVHKALLVRAEISRVEGKLDAALEGYADAAGASHAQGALVDEALAHELTARLHSSLGRTTTARAAAQEAMRLYARWGSLGKVEAVAMEFMGFSRETLSLETWASSSGSISAARLDLLSVLKMAEGISCEVVPERLFERLLTLGLEVASAQNAVLVLRNDERYEVRARGAASEQVVLLRASLDETKDLPRALVRATLARSAPVMVNDAQTDPVYGADEYVRATSVKSAVAIPIRRKGEIRGALYLESRLAVGAFAEARVRLLELLSSQMAISLENSLLFERLEAEIHDRRRAEDRVRFLANSSMALADGIGLNAILQTLTQVAVPFLADWATTYVLTADGTLRRAASRHADPRMQDLLNELAERAPTAASPEQPAAVAVRTGEPVLYSDISDSTIPEARLDARQRELIRRLGNRSMIAVPLVARGRRVGALALHAGGGRPRFAAADVTLAQELARRAATSFEKARLEADLSQSQKYEAIGRLSGGIAHDFNNFLTVVFAGAEALSNEPGLGPQGGEAVTEILAATQAAAEITRRLLAVGRQQSLSPQIVSVNDFLQSSIRMFRALAGEGVDVVLDLGSEAGEISVDRGQLIQILMNLITNANEAMPRGGTITVRTTEVLLESEPQPTDETARRAQVCISVADTGVGMNQEMLEHLFEPFYTSKAAGKGTGIGLATVRGIVAQSGGTIDVESVLGVGSRFTVCFPKVIR